MRFTMAGAMLLAAAAPALAQVNGRATIRCAAPLQIADDTVRAEVYTLRVQGGTPASYTDYGFDVSGKTMNAASATPTLCRLSTFTWTRDANDREFATASPSDVEYAIITAPPEAPGGACRIMVDSGIASSPSMLAGTTQYVGAGNGWLVAPVPPGARGTKANAGAAFNGAELQFGMVSELEPPGRMPLGANCFIGGAAPRPGTTATVAQGLIVGYNVFRVQGTAGTTPQLSDFMRNDAWQYYVNVETFDNDMDASGLPMPQRDETPPATAASDNAANDLSGLQNSDGVFYTGEERLFFQDTGFLPDGSMRSLQGAASLTVENSGYWYAVQPVLSMGGQMNTLFSATGFTNNNVFNGNHVINVAVTGGMWQGIDLDLDGTPEFLNPQVAAGIQGLGLTNSSLPLLSAPVFADTSTAALPADTQVVVSAQQTGNKVNIEFTVGLTVNQVEGYNVYRLANGERTLVNKTLIAPQGAEGGVYSIEDNLVSGSARRVQREAGPVQYEVEIRYVNAPSKVVGPFDVVIAGRENRRTR